LWKSKWNIPVDTGGWTHYYLQKYPNIRKRKINWINAENSLDYLIENKIPNNDLIEYLKIKSKINKDMNYKEGLEKPYSEVGENVFVHFSAGSNWNGNSPKYHIIHQKALYDYLSKICDLSMINFDQIRLTQKFLKT
jgi:hypothetical protein